MDFRTNCY